MQTTVNYTHLPFNELFIGQGRFGFFMMCVCPGLIRTVIMNFPRRLESLER